MNDKQKSTILNVNDNDSVRHIISEILQHEGFEVIEAPNGAEALRLVKEAVPDLILLDVKLPDIDGFEVCRRIKADSATSMIPVLHLSGVYLENQDRVKGLGGGADGYLTLPVASEVLIAYVKALLRARQAEVKASAMAGQWQATFDAMNDAVLLSDMEGKILRCNKAMRDLLGKPSEEIFGRTCWELIYGTTEPVERCPIVRMRETHRRETTVLQMDDRWFHVTADPMLDAHGTLIGAVYLMSDITGSKRAEEKIKAAREYNQNLIDSSLDMIISVDKERRIVEFNRAAQKTFGYGEEEVLGKPISILYADPVEGLKAHKTIRGSGQFYGEILNKRKNGEVFSSFLSASVLRNANGEFLGEMGVSRDITERKRAEEALQYRVDVEKLVVAISTNLIGLSSDEVDIGINGVLQIIGEFVGVDRGYVFLFSDEGTKADNTHEWCAEGVEPQIEKLEGLPVEAFPWWMEKLNRFESIYIPRVADLRSEASGEKETLQSRDIQSLMVLPMVSDRSVVGFLGFDSVRAEKKWAEEDIALLGMVGGIVVDTLKRKRTEEALRIAKEGAESASRAKSEFLASMSHELRTPLSAIIGFSEILKDQTFGELNAKQAKYISNVLTSGRHLLEMVSGILDMVKLESEKMELELSEVDVVQALRDVENMFKASAAEKTVTLTVELEKDLPPLTADRNGIRQIMRNLLSNAIKFTPEGGSVRVGVRLIADYGIRIAALEGKKPESAVRNLQSAIEISVADSGIGIRPEDQKRVFGAFEQMDSSYARAYQGTGLGLALTRRLVELHGGRVWVESEGEGKGSTFTFLIPVEAQE